MKEAAVSGFGGFLFGFLGFFALCLMDMDHPFPLALLSGVLFGFLLFLVLIVWETVSEKRYAKLEKEILSPVFYQTGTLIALGPKKVRSGKVYFCEAGIVLISLDEKPCLMEEIRLQDIERYQFDNIHLHIFTKDGRMFVLTFPNVREAMDALKQRDWI